MFTELYLRTTDPLAKDIPMKMISISIIFHTIIYLAFLNMFSVGFRGEPLSFIINIRLIIIFIVIMFLGYIGRFYHVKDIYKGYRGDLIKCREHIDKHYNSWVFIG